MLQRDSAFAFRVRDLHRACAHVANAARCEPIDERARGVLLCDRECVERPTTARIDPEQMFVRCSAIFVGLRPLLELVELELLKLGIPRVDRAFERRDGAGVAALSSKRFAVRRFEHRARLDVVGLG